MTRSGHSVTFFSRLLDRMPVMKKHLPDAAQRMLKGAMYFIGGMSVLWTVSHFFPRFFDEYWAVVVLICLGISFRGIGLAVNVLFEQTYDNWH